MDAVYSTTTKLKITPGNHIETSKQQYKHIKNKEKQSSRHQAEMFTVEKAH